LIHFYKSSFTAGEDSIRDLLRITNKEVREFISL
jgi:hypothetical protein